MAVPILRIAFPVLLAALPARAWCADEPYALHAQATFVDQAALAFRSPYQGANSLDPRGVMRETADVTLYAGVRPWAGAELWIDPEIDQGFGLSDTLGVAGFPSGEAYKVGRRDPYLRLQRAYVRQTIDLGGEGETADPDLMTLGATHTADRLVLTVGKLSVGDIFDTNRYAHDPRGDFMNWSVIDAGSFDYAADAWGYSYGAAAEWREGPWTLRLGLFDMSRDPNGEILDDSFRQMQGEAEVERRYALFGQAGAVRITAFDSRARLGDFADAIRQAQRLGGVPDLTAVRRYRGHAGISLDLEQAAGQDLGLFFRAGMADGHQQSYEFTDIDQTVSLGAALTGRRWGRTDDVVGVAGAVNAVSHDFEAYLAAGGLGILIGDGRLPHPGPEGIVEAYYSLAAAKGLHVSFDYQRVEHPAYNRDRGPVSILGLRLHAAA